MTDTLHHDRTEMNVLFVHSEIDDAGLSAAQFRVYCHLARRARDNGAAWPSIESMARICRLEPKTVRAAIRDLDGFGMLRIEARSGSTNRYILTRPSEWRCPVQGEPIPNGTRGAKRESSQTAPGVRNGRGTKRHQGGTTKRHQGDPSQTAPAEGNPNQGNPVKEIQGEGGESPLTPLPPAPPSLASDDLEAEQTPEQKAAAKLAKDREALERRFLSERDWLTEFFGQDLGSRIGHWQRERSRSSSKAPKRHFADAVQELRIVALKWPKHPSWVTEAIETALTIHDGSGPRGALATYLGAVLLRRSDEAAPADPTAKGAAVDGPPDLDAVKARLMDLNANRSDDVEGDRQWVLRGLVAHGQTDVAKRWADSWGMAL